MQSNNTHTKDKIQGGLPMKKEIKANNETTFELSNEFYNFTTIQNYILEDGRLTDNAIGLYMRIARFQNSKGHKIFLSGLITEVNTRRKVTNAMNELLEFGYISREAIRNEKGHFKGYKYIVYSKPLNPCDINVSTECTKTEIGKTEFGKVTTKKENGLKKKITKKENKISQEPREIDNRVELIISKTNLKPTKAEQEIICTWDIDKLEIAIEKHIAGDGGSFKYLAKCYTTASTKSNTGANKKPNKAFTNIYTHDTDLDELEKQADDYFMGDLSEEDLERAKKYMKQ